MMSNIYLDNNATTLPDPKVRERITALLQHPLGNPSSAHNYGREAREIINDARRKIAALFHVKPIQVVFTSSGTESLNQVLIEACFNIQEGHIISGATEHACVYNTLQRLVKGSKGRLRAVYIRPVDQGPISPSQLEQSIQPDTRLIALMAANNETGLLHDVEAFASIASSHGIPLVIDAVSLIGKQPFSLPQGVSALCFSGHKFHAPPGTGITILQRPLHKLPPLITGGSQENGFRAGTENVISISATALALEIAYENLSESHRRMSRQCHRLLEGLESRCGPLHVNGKGPKLCNTLNISFDRMDGESLLIQLDRAGIAASHGSACTTGALEPSRILLELGIPLERAHHAVRFSLSRFTTDDEIEETISRMEKIFI